MISYEIMIKAMECWRVYTVIKRKSILSYRKNHKNVEKCICLLYKKAEPHKRIGDPLHDPFFAPAALFLQTITERPVLSFIVHIYDT